MIITMSDLENIDIQMELKDRLNYPEIISASLLRLKKSVGESSKERRINQRLILDFLTDIPNSWRDKAFVEELKGVITIKTVDVRPSFAGIKASYNYCKVNNIKTTMEKKNINYFKLKHAIINLLDRKNLLIRKEKIEYTSGENLNYATLEELEAEYDKEYRDDE